MKIEKPKRDVESLKTMTCDCCGRTFIHICKDRKTDVRVYDEPHVGEMFVSGAR
jgi:hypothetical protein